MAARTLAFTRDGYRYHWGEDDPQLCRSYRDAIKLNETLKKSNLFRRKVSLPSIRLSESDRAPQLKLEGDLTVTGEKGYSMIRATHGINRGTFYYEVTIERMQDGGLTAARVGWGQRYANLQAPLGYDQYGYSYRSRFGTKFHQARGKTYDKSGGYREGDTVGCLIHLPHGNKRGFVEGRHLPPSIKETTLVCNFKKKDSNDKPKMLEEKDKPQEQLNTIPGSQISFYKNGRCIGVAFEDIYEGWYYPTVSLYKDCRVKLNFGPKFRYPPAQNGHPSSLWRPASDMAQIEPIDNFLSDLLFIVSSETAPEGNKIEMEIRKILSS